MEEKKERKSRIKELENKLEEQSKLIEKLLETKELFQFTGSPAKSQPIPSIVSIDPERQRALEKEKYLTYKKANETRESWFEVVNGKKRKVTQLWLTMPDGTKIKGNRWKEYVGKATDAEKTVILNQRLPEGTRAEAKTG